MPTTKTILKPLKSIYKLLPTVHSAYTPDPHMASPQSPDDNPLLNAEAPRKDVESQKRYKQSRIWGLAVGTLVGIVVISFFALLTMGPYKKHKSHDRIPSLSLQEMRSGAYRSDSPTYHWVPEGTGGQYLTRNSKDEFVIMEVGSTEELFLCSQSPEIAGTRHQVFDVLVNHNNSRAVVKTDYKKNFRHSSFGQFWLLNVAESSFESIFPDNPDALVSVAHFSPDGEKVAFVYENNLYVREVASKTVHQVTDDGAANIFNGNPDWVYEEEVFSGDTAFWWSRDSNYVLYLRTNDTQVPSYPLEYFVKEGANQYPSVVNINYPKPGVANPIDDLYVYNYAQESSHLVPIDLPDKIVTEVVWGPDQAIVKVMTRDSDTLEVHLVDAASHSSSVVRKYDALQDGGWFEITHNSVFVPSGHGRSADGYIDTLTVDGYNHLGYFSPMNATEPVALTSGKWEVADIPYAFNPELNTVFFTATKEAPTRQNIYSVNLDSPREVKALTENGFYSASYSGGATHAVISYQGPDIPSTEVRDLKENHAVVTYGNDHLKETLANRTLPSVHFTQVQVAEGVMVNVREIRPSSFDESLEYPVLFYNYGGPGSQMVQETFSIDFQTVFAESHNAIVVTVDPRGTGYMGREFRSVVRDKLGYYESRDVIEVAKQWNAKKYVDPNVTAIWGWSYGGFLTLKTLETDGGEQFKFGVAVAPVTDWRLYDSIYTERYMHTPQNNTKGYEESSITNVKNIAKARRFMIMHGTGDDNVHIQNTYRLLDQFDQQGVENYDMHVYPDSDHSIYFHNANTIVYDKLDKWLLEHQSVHTPSDEV